MTYEEATKKWPGKEIHNYRLLWTSQSWRGSKHSSRTGRATQYAPFLDIAEDEYMKEYPERIVTDGIEQW